MLKKLKKLLLVFILAISFTLMACDKQSFQETYLEFINEVNEDEFEYIIYENDNETVISYNAITKNGMLPINQTVDQYLKDIPQVINDIFAGTLNKIDNYQITKENMISTLISGDYILYFLNDKHLVLNNKLTGEKETYEAPGALLIMSKWSNEIRELI